MTQTGAEPSVIVYAYDANNRLLTETRTAEGAETAVFRYTYDANGNQLSRFETRHGGAAGAVGAPSGVPSVTAHGVSSKQTELWHMYKVLRMCTHKLYEER